MKEKRLAPAILGTKSAQIKRAGVFEQGFDKLGRPYEKKLDTDGVYTKEEILKSGQKKLTIKK